jgi:hypothetical protein
MEKKISGSCNEAIVLKHDFLEININKAIVGLYFVYTKRTKNVPYKVSKSINTQQSYKQSKADHHGKGGVDACREQEEEEEWHYQRKAVNKGHHRATPCAFW